MSASGLDTTNGSYLQSQSLQDGGEGEDNSIVSVGSKSRRQSAAVVVDLNQNVVTGDFALTDAGEGEGTEKGEGMEDKSGDGSSSSKKSKKKKGWEGNNSVSSSSKKATRKTSYVIK